MHKISLTAQVRELFEAAADHPHGRSAKTLYGGHGHALSQTVIALNAGHSLNDRDNDGEATIQVLLGRVRLSAADLNWEAMVGDLIIIPTGRHSVLALSDAAMLLTTAKPSPAGGAPSRRDIADASADLDLVTSAPTSAWSADGWVSP